MEGVSWHPDLGHVALDAVAFGISRRFRRKTFHEARGPGEPRYLLHLREQCGALRVHLAWSRSKKVQVPLDKWHIDRKTRFKSKAPWIDSEMLGKHGEC